MGKGTLIYIVTTGSGDDGDEVKEHGYYLKEEAAKDHADRLKNNHISWDVAIYKVRAYEEDTGNVYNPTEGEVEGYELL